MIETLENIFEKYTTNSQLKSQFNAIIVELPTKNFDQKLGFLQISTEPVFYFNDPNEQFFGIGSAYQIEGDPENRIAMIRQSMIDISQKLNIIDDLNGELKPRLFGGITFSSNPPSTIWKDFGTSTFILPNILIHHDKETNRIAAILIFDHKKRIIELFGKLLNTLNNIQVNKEIKVVSIDYPISVENWVSTIDKAHKLMKEKTLKKVVLSRNVEIVTEEEPSPIQIMQNLNSNYPECYNFILKNKESSFFGASPELLLEVSGQKLSTIALAGTRPRGNSKKEDENLATELLANTKERNEHDLVVQQIVSQLQSYNPKFTTTPEIMKLTNVQHLVTYISAELDQDVRLIDLLEKLHPTPALGGKPREEALNFIYEHEPHYRGLYASPIGWIDLNFNGKFVVAIRSALSTGKQTWLYAGAGIMEQSDAIKEWDEIELKFKPILEALGVVL